MEQKQTVLIVHNRYRIAGGEDTVAENERKLLEANGHRVIVYERSNAERLGLFQKLALPFAALYNPRTAREVRKIIRREGVDVVHVHNTLSLVSPSVYLAAKRCKVPLVQTVHNFRLLCPGATFFRDGKICEDCLAKGQRCAVKHACYRKSKLQTLTVALSNRLYRRTYRSLHYICLTQFTKDKLSSLVPADRIFVKPNFTYDEGGKRGEGKYYLFVGRLEEIKGVRLLVEAFRGTDYSLKIVGSGPLEEELSAAAKDCPNIELCGRKDRAEVNALMQGAKALVMCSQWYETFGMVIVEAYANGTPAIVGDVGNIRGLVRGGETGFLFRYDSAEALRAAVERCERADLSAMSANAYACYRAAYSPEQNYKTLKAVYDELCGQK